ncbi:MAG: FxLYD domain-containing protein [Thermoproteota archaeon]|nr:FxLYD domain-containing protein [Thermoproteota archaeon]
MKSIKAKSVKLSRILDIPYNGRNVKPYFIALIFLCGLVAILELTVSNTFFSPIHAQIEITTDENITPPIFNKTKSEDSQSRPDILYSALNKDTVVGEVLNNFSYPIELVRITATVYDKNGVIVATGDKYVNDYLIQPGSRSGFDIFLDETLPSESKYILTTSFEKSEDVNPEALQLSVGKNSKTSNSFKVLGEVMNQGKSDANAVKVSAIFYDEGHKVIDTDYVYTNPDIIGPNKKAPFEFSFYVGNPDKIKSMAFNVQSDEYSLMTNNGQNNTISQQ